MPDIFLEKWLPEVEEHVTGLFRRYPHSYLVYHNLSHTQQVVAHAAEIGAFYKLDNINTFVLLTAAWFHDTGHLFVDPKWHEIESMNLASHFLKPFAPELVHPVAGCILATRMPQHPRTLLESILCDADLYHLGTDDFRYSDEQVKKETALRRGNTDNWKQRSLAMLQAHRFHTGYCREKLMEGKQRNIEWLSSR